MTVFKIKATILNKHIFFYIGEQLWCSGLESAKGLWGIIKTNYLEQILQLYAEMQYMKIKTTMLKTEACFNWQQTLTSYFKHLMVNSKTS